MTEQEKREEVIKGLECCTAELGTHQHQDDFCAVCPYKDKGPEMWYCFHKQDLMRDALALLKAQEPHIVTIADYENNPVVDKDGNLAVWRESRHLNGIAYHNDGWVILNRNRVEGWFNSEMIRFWTSRPTDAQREAEVWHST